MILPPTARLSAATLASLAELGGIAPAQHGSPVTPRGGGVTLPTSSVTKDFPAISTACLAGFGTVTPARELRTRNAVSDTWEERAAILEHDGGLSREAAERMASLLLSFKQMDSSDADMRALDRELVAMDQRRD